MKMNWEMYNLLKKAEGYAGGGNVSFMDSCLDEADRYAGRLGIDISKEKGGIERIFLNK